ncbi:hypothetical protein E4U40_007868, partial [Claviceps sp. LM458 group G5]
ITWIPSEERLVRAEMYALMKAQFTSSKPQLQPVNDLYNAELIDPCFEEADRRIIDSPIIKTALKKNNRPAEEHTGEQSTIEDNASERDVGSTNDDNTGGDIAKKNNTIDTIL